MAYETNEAGLERIYKDFLNQQQHALRGGFLPDSVFTDRLGGYVVGFRLDDEVTEKLTAVASAIAQSGIFAYGPDELHTTISDFAKAPDFDPGADPKHNQIIADLSAAVDESVGKMSSVAVRYSNEGCIFNRTTLICHAQPWRNQGTTSFWEAAQLVNDAAAKRGMNLRMPWGAHVTIARVREKMSAEDVLDVADTLRKKRPQWNYSGSATLFPKIFVGSFRATADSFKLTVNYERKLELGV